jgi:hypothetical protein
LPVFNVHIDKGHERRMRNDRISIHVGSSSSIKNESWMIILSLVLDVSNVSSNLGNHILFSHPQRTHMGPLHYRVFSDYLWPDCVRPIHLINSVIVSQNQ